MSDIVKIKNVFGTEKSYPVPEIVNLRSNDESLIPYVKNGVNTDDATATVADILEGKTAYVAGEKIIGELISSGDEKFCVRFIDYDGTILKTEYVGEGEDATPPALPDYSEDDHDNRRPALTFQEWNNDYVNITEDVDIGAIWIPSDGKTYFYLDNIELLKPIKLNIVKTAPATVIIETSWAETITITDSSTFFSVFLNNAPQENRWITIVATGGTWRSGGAGLFNSYIGSNGFQAGSETILLKSAFIGNSFTNTASYMFWHMRKLQYLTIPANSAITRLMDARYCNVLEHVNMPSSITHIEEGFRGCYSLKNVVFSKNIIYINQQAFYDCVSIQNILLPIGIDRIGVYAFYNCNSLSSINIPDGVTSIGNDAFYNCNSLSSINIPDDVTSIGANAFYNCNSLSSINIPDGVTSIGSSAFYNCRSLSSIIIPDGVTSIGNNVFNGCSSLSSINIPNGVTSIGSSAFRDCDSLSSINIPDGVTSIGTYTFSGCYSLSSINIPDGVISIGNYAFQNCYSLSSINIPDSITSIGTYTFQNCNSLSSINIPDGVISIGTYTFSYCYSLSSINIPDGVISIGGGAFYCCYSLSSINIPDGVTSIDGSAFSHCNSLIEVILLGITPPTLANVNAFTSNHADRKFYVPDESVDEYKTATNWSTFAGVIFPLSDLEIEE